MLSTVITLAAEAESESAVSPYLVGGIVLALLLVLLLAVVSFGGGREHS
jgi:capsular polysaccharide biosynthesis protein